MVPIAGDRVSEHEHWRAEKDTAGQRLTDCGQHWLAAVLRVAQNEAAQLGKKGQRTGKAPRLDR